MWFLFQKVFASGVSHGLVVPLAPHGLVVDDRGLDLVSGRLDGLLVGLQVDRRVDRVLLHHGGVVVAQLLQVADQERRHDSCRVGLCLGATVDRLPEAAVGRGPHADDWVDHPLLAVFLSGRGAHH